MTWNTILFEKRGKTACMTLNRPKTLNSISIEMMKELDAAYREVEEDEDILTLIFTGAGEKALCTGAGMAVFEKAFKDGHPSGVDLWGEPFLSKGRGPNAFIEKRDPAWKVG
jgi:enoyl-CoA hydratase/carnithine racemase